MAWELQSQMECLIRPSLEAYFEGHESPGEEAGRILCYQRTEGETNIEKIEEEQARCDNDVERLGLSWAIETIAGHAESVATTSNGGWNFYCDEGGWCEVAFVEEEEEG